MKKILSVLLAVMMLFGALSISSSAAYINSDADAMTAFATTTANSTKPQAIILYELNGGTVSGEPVYDITTGKFSTPANYAGETNGYYYRIPQNTSELVFGTSIPLPLVTPPSGWTFSGWQCMKTGDTAMAGPGSSFTLDYDNVKNGANIIHLKAVFVSATQEEDTMAKVMGILTKVFGAIIGILFYNGDTGAGVKLMEQILGGLSL